MFLSLNNLNEGSISGNRLENRKRELIEGENPKVLQLKQRSTGWQSAKIRQLVNSNWQKLRR
ncbi:MAG: hypothetical protein J7L95_01550 [Prolixibacteraceae bacterium]|nr:hypothetical protein [Prolixibacteraceae bacterium]